MDFAEQIAMIFSFIADAESREFERKNRIVRGTEDDLRPCRDRLRR